MGWPAGTFGAMRVIAITQARMTSSRLPGKVMRKAAGKTLLAHHVDRVRRARTLDAIVVATTNNAADDVIADWCDEAEVPVYRGSERDVLARYAEVAAEYEADVVVRVTSDCPLIDPDVMDATISAFLAASSAYDYASNRIVQTFPRGLDTEVLPAPILFLADREATLAADREHVTLFVCRQPERFRLLNVPADSDWGQHRWTVDTAEDFELVRRMLEDLMPDRPKFTLGDCLDCIGRHPDWPAINAHVRQKEVRLETGAVPGSR